MAYNGDGKLPIIYVRGFAGGTGAINTAVDDPFYGFSQGSVHVRSDGNGQPQFYQFESPMLRLMTDQGYQVPVYGDQRLFLEKAESSSIDAPTVWIHRFYDVSASTFADHATEFTLEQAAKDLFALIRLVLEKTGAPKVFLVAHSMGGLVCRSVLQRIIPEATPAADGSIDPAAGANYVARVFTYATPHGGISFAIGNGLLERIRDATGFQGADIFGPDRMYQYLTPGVPFGASAPDDFNATRMPENGFSVDNLFCLVGSNPENYDVALGLSSQLVGARSDGLVQIENAAVQNAHRAVVHRSHSGRYGIVNSEEGYQNLQRFLFGDLQITVELLGLDVGRGAPDDVEFQLDVGLAIRGLPVLVHQQSAQHYCPVLVERRSGDDSVDTPKPLFTTFLSSRAGRPKIGSTTVPTLRHALKLRLLSIREEQGRFFFADHLEQTEDWQDALLVDIEPGGAGALPRAWAAWTSLIPTSLRDWQPTDANLLTDLDATVDRWYGEMPVPSIARGLLGDRARVGLSVSPRAVMV
jgi:pimeloyl-ACP methyl ester carboxylesterase